VLQSVLKLRNLFRNRLDSTHISETVISECHSKCGFIVKRLSVLKLLQFPFEFTKFTKGPGVA
jgi:hypothetical protein